MDLTRFEGNSTVKKATSIVLPESDYTPDFLFINATSGSLTNKDRRTIRSHVRKYASKQKAEIGQRMRNHVLAPRSLSHNLVKTLPQGRNYLSNISATSGQSSIRRHGTLDPEILNVNDSGKKHVWYCSACEEQREVGHGRHHHESKVREASTTICMHLWRTPQPSPVGILGAGTKDPFSSLPIENPTEKDHELIGHAKNLWLADLIPDERPNNNNGANTGSKAWFRFGLDSPLVFHALVFGSSVHLDFLRWSKFFPDSPNALSHKLAVMHRLKELISKDSKLHFEDLIVAILILACHEEMDTSPITEAEKKHWPFNDPLGRGKWLNMYSGVRVIPEHRKALVDVVNLGGGLESIKLYGLADLVVAADVKVAVASFSKPTLPQLQRHKADLASLTAWAASLPRMARPVASAFRNFQDLGITDMLLQNLELVGAYTTALDYYHRGKSGGLSLAVITRTKWALQQQLLLLSPAQELNKTPLSKLSFYECCRLTLHIFGLAVVFIDTSDAYSHLQTLVTRLKAWLERLYIYGYGTDSAHLLLWMLALGGIAALGKPERPWFASRLAIVLHRLNITWDNALEILERFLWLENACGSEGRELWSEAVKSLALLV
ncbi:hypothetical protein V8E51_002783 [Hyaloscypha variabilis]